MPTRRGRHWGDMVESDEDSGSVDDPTKDRSGVPLEIDEEMLPGTKLQDTALSSAGRSEVEIGPSGPDSHVEVIGTGLLTPVDEQDVKMRCSLYTSDSS